MSNVLPIHRTPLELEERHARALTRQLRSTAARKPDREWRGISRTRAVLGTESDEASTLPTVA
jgi:hypothetical protein